MTYRPLKNLVLALTVLVGMQAIAVVLPLYGDCPVGAGVERAGKHLGRSHLQSLSPFALRSGCFGARFPGLAMAMAQETGEGLSNRTVSEPGETPRQVINQVPPTPKGLGIYVNDATGLLSPQDKATLQTALQALDEAGIAQVSVLVLPDTDRELPEFAPMIMNRWDIQHHKKRDGLLVLVNAHNVLTNARRNRIFVGTGYNLEGPLPDAVVGRVLDQQALPAFQQGEYSTGITQATLTLVKILSGDKELRASYAQPPSRGPDWPTVVFFLILLFIIFKNSRRGPGGGFWGGLGGGYYGGGGFGGFGGGDGGGFGGGFGGGGDSSGGGGAGR